MSRSVFLDAGAQTTVHLRLTIIWTIVSASPRSTSHGQGGVIAFSPRLSDSGTRSCWGVVMVIVNTWRSTRLTFDGIPSMLAAIIPRA